MRLSFEEKYAIVVRRDPAYAGRFVFAVKTTGIFCLPHCPSRTPKPANITFFDHARQALAGGFRPCKKCKPLVQPGQIPPGIDRLLRYMQLHPGERIKNSGLHRWNLRPATLNRWFKKQHHMSFQSYQRLLRMHNAMHQIQEGTAITAAAFDTGFHSVSGFNARFRSVFGTAPSKAKHTTLISLQHLATPLGTMYAGATEKGLVFLEFTDRLKLEDELKGICRKLNGIILPGDNPHLRQTKRELEEYFAGKRKNFELSLHFTGTDFQERVWNSLRQIPYGHTMSYAQQAAALGMPTALRAIASANGKNRLAIVVPCHRVLGSNGHLTGYSGGITRKKGLIDFEQGKTLPSIDSAAC